MAILIKPNGVQEVVTPKNGKVFSLRELKGFVDGWIEIVDATENGKVLVINEEGKLLRLPPNSVATQKYKHGSRDEIVGNALLADLSEVY